MCQQQLQGPLLPESLSQMTDMGFDACRTCASNKANNISVPPNHF